MRYEYTDTSDGILRLLVKETHLQRQFFKERQESLLAIAWNRGHEQTVFMDEIPIKLPANSFITMMVSQSFRFENPTDIVLWQYNKSFYCIIEHDKEVSCVGFLFYGTKGSMLIRLDEQEAESFNLLLKVFEEEFKQKDTIQGEMLRALLKRLIIKLTRLGKQQYVEEGTTQPALDIVRQYSLMVENNYKKLHQVQDYASMMNKSPKTLANLFALQHQPSPLQIITNRLILEARRLLIYTDKSSSEIAYELGFEEPTHFSRFFKKEIGQTPIAFKSEHKNFNSGNIG